MVKFNNVSFAYGKKQILKDFNLEINEKDRICLFAPSGYGKTTLLRLIAGLEKPQSGTVEGVKDKTFSVVFQEDRLIPTKTVLQNVALFGEEETAKEYLIKLGLSDSLNLYPAELSGGMARRVAIARALCRKGDIYIFDEPFNGIDQENLENTARFILEKTKDKTFIAVSHSSFEAELLKTKIVNI